MTSNAWPHVQLKDCVDLLAGFAFKSASFSEVASDIALVKGENVSQGKILWDISKRWPVADWQKLEKYQLAIGDVILAMDRPWIPAGLKWAFIRPEDPPALLVQRCSRLRSNSSTLFQGFLRYVIGSSEFEDYVRPITTGVNVPHISGSQILSFKLRLPPVSIQRRIAEILAAYDDLIENCERRIRILDEMARKLYREWFVHFRYPGHENVPLVDSALGKIPKGWTAGTVGDFFDTSSGGTPSRKIPEYFGGPHQWVKTQELQDRFVLSTQETITDAAIARSSAKLFPARTILVAMYGATIGQLGILAAPAATNQACCSLVAKSGVADFGYVYLFMQEQKQQLIHLATGAAQPNVSQQVIRRLELVKPSAEVQILFRNIITPKYELVLQIQQVADNLRRTRDLLLPRLLSGQLDVGAMA